MILSFQSAITGLQTLVSPKSPCRSIVDDLQKDSPLKRLLGNPRGVEALGNWMHHIDDDRIVSALLDPKRRDPPVHERPRAVLESTVSQGMRGDFYTLVSEAAATQPRLFRIVEGSYVRELASPQPFMATIPYRYSFAARPIDNIRYRRWAKATGLPMPKSVWNLPGNNPVILPDMDSIDPWLTLLNLLSGKDYSIPTVPEWERGTGMNYKLVTGKEALKEKGNEGLSVEQFVAKCWMKRYANAAILWDEADPYFIGGQLIIGESEIIEGLLGAGMRFSMWDFWSKPQDVETDIQEALWDPVSGSHETRPLSGRYFPPKKAQREKRLAQIQPAVGFAFRLSCRSP